MPILVLIILGVFVVGAIIGIVQWAHNNKQPQVSHEARVVLIDDRFSGEYVNSGGDRGVNLSREYRVTFVFLSTGKRKKLEFRLPSSSILAGCLGSMIQEFSHCKGRDISTSKPRPPAICLYKQIGTGKA